MTERIQPVLENFIFFIAWIAFAVLVTLTLFQVHGTIISIAVFVVDTPSLRPTGWNSGSVILLTRFLWLVMGIIWLGWVIYTFDYLMESNQLQHLMKRVLRLLLILGAVYLSSYLILLILA
jgi:hypothetical protein